MAKEARTMDGQRQPELIDMYHTFIDPAIPLPYVNKKATKVAFLFVE